MWLTLAEVKDVASYSERPQTFLVSFVLACCCFSHFWLFATPWTVAHQAPLSMEFSRQEYWSGLSCPPPGALPDPGIKHISLPSPEFAGGFFPTWASWEARSWSHNTLTFSLFYKCYEATEKKNYFYLKIKQQSINGLYLKERGFFFFFRCWVFACYFFLNMANISLLFNLPGELFYCDLENYNFMQSTLPSTWYHGKSCSKVWKAQDDNK